MTTMRPFICFAIVASSACSVFGSEDGASNPPPTDVPDAAVDGQSPVIGIPGERDFSVSVAPGATQIVQGGTAKIHVTIVRGSQLDTGIALAASGFPAGVTIKTVISNGTGADLEMSAAADAPQGAAEGLLEAKSAGIAHTLPLKAFVRGKPGAVDTTYGVGGGVGPLFGAKVRGTAIDLVLAADDSVYAVGNADDPNLPPRIIHVDPTGAVDAAYGTGGRATINVYAGHSAAIQPDGKVLVLGGTGSSNSAIGRLLTTGAPDPGFGDAALGPGTKLLGTGGLNGSNLGALVASLRKDGDIFLAWDNLDAAATKNGSMQLTPAGELRTTYGAGGAGRNAIALTTGIAVRNDGGPSDGNLAMLAVNSGAVIFQQISPTTGAFDPLVGGQKTNFIAGAKRSAAGPQGIVVFPDGSIAGAFQATDGLHLLKFTAVGAPSPGFGTSGIAGPYASPGEPTGIALQSDGKLLVSYDTGGLSRFTTTGLRDDEFGDHGNIPPSAPTVQARRSVVVQKNGRILVGGELGTTLVDGSITAYWP